MTDVVKPAGLRATNVYANEERILRAALDLFVRDGYRTTTLTAVAAAAGVADRTVYVRFGTKAALLKRAIDLAVAGDLEPIAVAGRPWYLTAISAPTLDERIVAYAKGAARLMGAAADIIAVGREAAGSEALIAAAAQAGRAATRDTVRGFWTSARDAGLLAPDCDVDWLADTTSVLAHAETYLVMRETLNMTPRRYEKWVIVTLHRLATAAATSVRS